MQDRHVIKLHVHAHTHTHTHTLEHISPEVDLQTVGLLGLSSKPSTQRQWKLPWVLMQRWEQG